MQFAAQLRSYSEAGSESAFAEFVRQGVPLVYRAALHRVGGDHQLAEDVTQQVFAAAARDAGRLARHPDVTGWLFTTARFLAAKTVRGERRRAQREREFARVYPDDDSLATDPDRLRAMLDESMLELSEIDRQVLLLRFYGGRRLAEIAGECNSSENAVQKRIERALARLNALLARRGITSTAAALALTLEQHGAVAVPTGLVSAATEAGLRGSAAGVGNMAPAASGTFAKLSLLVAAAVVAVGIVGVVWKSRDNTVPRAEAKHPNALPRPDGVHAAPGPVAARETTVPSAPVGRTVAVPIAPAVRDLPEVAVQPGTSVGTVAPRDGAMVPLKVEYPQPLYQGAPRPRNVPNLEAATGTVGEMRLPAAAVLLSRGRPVTSSDNLPVIGALSLITDGDKSGREGAYVELGPNPQWIQIDLGESAVIHAIAVWHYHAQARVYHDVVVRIGDEGTSAAGATTVFNNDHDNSSRLGAGHDPAYVETHRGRLIDGRGAKGRYVRLYSNGNSSDELNHYCEVEVYGERAR